MRSRDSADSAGLPEASATTIWTDLDLEADGKQVGYLHLPYSVTRSAYGTIAIPIAVVGNGAGPTALLTAGNHGDEYEGQVAITKLIRQLEPSDIAGRVIMLPALNLPAAMAGARVSPLDDGNLNRAFPGDPAGRPTAQIAYYVEHELVPRCQLWIDLHSGGSSLDYLPLAATYLFGTTPHDAQAIALLRAFNASLSIIWGMRDDPRLAIGAARRADLVYLATEAGGTGSIAPDGVRLCEQGVIGCLAQLGVLRNRSKFPPAPRVATRMTELTDRSYYVYAPEPGLLEWFCRLGDEVKEGQPAACIHFVDNPARPPITVPFRRDGLLVCKRHPARVERGDCIAHLATDFQGALP